MLTSPSCAGTRFTYFPDPDPCAFIHKAPVSQHAQTSFVDSIVIAIDIFCDHTSVLAVSVSTDLSTDIMLILCLLSVWARPIPLFQMEGKHDICKFKPTSFLC